MSRTSARGARATLDGTDLIDQVILGMMSNASSPEQVARLICAAFPARFGSLENALARVSTLYEKYRA